MSHPPLHTTAANFHFESFLYQALELKSTERVSKTTHHLIKQVVARGMACTASTYRIDASCGEGLRLLISLKFDIDAEGCSDWLVLAWMMSTGKK